jgi:CO/xanthine dehydrogenase FAD-binding subunit
MKAAPFEYARAESLDHACELLAEHGDEAKVIAGGQSLVPMLAMRLLAPAWLVDIQRISGLQQVSLQQSELVVGAGVRQSVLESNPKLDESVPLLRQALRWVGHAPTRNRGTIGGSLAHADPSAELPLVAALLEARMTIRSARGERQAAASDFFTGPMMTCLEPDECLVDVRFPVWTGDYSGSAFDEISTRHGDFAIVAAAAQVSVDSSGICTQAAFAIGGAGPTPLAFGDLARRLVGSRLDDGLLREVARDAASRVEPTNDLQASAVYRRHLAAVMAERVLRSARQKVST